MGTSNYLKNIRLFKLRKTYKTIIISNYLLSLGLTGSVGFDSFRQFDPRFPLFLPIININCFFMFPTEFEFELSVPKYGSYALLLIILDSRCSENRV